MTELQPRVDAMKPSRPASTRTAAPRLPDHFPTRGRYRSYLLFGLCGGLLLPSSLLWLRGVRALGRGAAAWNALMQDFGHPLYLGYHVLALVGLVWFALRFFAIFPKAQPPRIGPLKPPPAPVILALLYGAFAVTTGVLALVLWGELL